MKVQLHTVFIEQVICRNPHTGLRHVAYETDFGGIHFSRTNLDTLKHWVRVAARNIYGKNTQVIFLERTDQQ